MARRSAPNMSFRGFVVLADIIFALAVGFMLLNPLKQPQPANTPPEPAAKPKAAVLQNKLDGLLVKLREGENDLKDLQRRMEEAGSKGRSWLGTMQ